jgi:hypothetical protein
MQLFGGLAPTGSVSLSRHAFTSFCFVPFLALCITNQPLNWNRPEMSKTALRNKKRREKQKEKKAGEGSSADDS